MAVTVLDSWTNTVDSDPSGSVTISSGSNRAAILALHAETDGEPVVSTMTIGGQAATQEYEIFQSDGVDDMTMFVYLWDESAIAAMSGSAISYADNATLTKRAWSFGTYAGVDQTTFPAAQASFLETSNSASSDVTTTSNDGERIVVTGIVKNSTGSLASADTLTEVVDVAAGSNSMRAIVAEGNGGDNTTTMNLNASLSHVFVSVVLGQTSAANPTLGGVGPGDLDIIFDNELRVEIDGVDFGATQGTGGVELHDSDPTAGTPATTVAQTENSWSDTLIVFEVDKGSITGDVAWIEVTTDGGGSDSKQIQLKDAPTANTPANRQDVAGTLLDLQANDAINFDGGSYLYHPNVQDALTFSAANLPDGLSISPDGIISGTISDNESASSPFTNCQVTCTDLDNNSVVDTFQWTVTGPTPDPPTESDTTNRKRRKRGSLTGAGRCGRL